MEWLPVLIHRSHGVLPSSLRPSGVALKKSQRPQRSRKWSSWRHVYYFWSWDLGGNATFSLWSGFRFILCNCLRNNTSWLRSLTHTQTHMHARAPRTHARFPNKSFVIFFRWNKGFAPGFSWFCGKQIPSYGCFCPASSFSRENRWHSL